MINQDDLKWTDPRELGTRAPFSTLFRIRPDLKAKIVDSMREGYDRSQPINVWRQENIVVDGHTRREAAIEAGVEVLVCFRDFKDEDEAMDYAIANQRNRRNLTDGELTALVLAVDERRTTGPRGKHIGKVGAEFSQKADEILHSSTRNRARSAKETADKIGLSSRFKVDQVRTIHKYAKETGDTEERDAVLNDTMTISEAAKRIKKKKPKRRIRKATKEKDKEAYRSVSLGNGKGMTAHPDPKPEIAEGHTIRWLEGFAIRERLANPKGFDADALIMRECNGLLSEIQSRIARLLGERSRSGMTSLHRALARVFNLPDPKLWYVCEKCAGSGRRELAACGTCNGGGYVIPNFTKEKP